MHDSQETTQTAGRCCDWSKTVNDFSARTEEFVRQEPAKAVGFAVLGGILLTVLPVGRLLALFVRLALSLVRPLLLVLGAVKLFEELDQRDKS